MLLGLWQRILVNMSDSATETATATTPAKRTAPPKPLEGKGCLLYDETQNRQGRLQVQNVKIFCHVSGYLSDSPDRFLNAASLPAERVVLSPGANFLSRDVWAKILAHGQNKGEIDKLQAQRIFEWIEPEKIPGTDSILDFKESDALRIIPRVYNRDLLERWQAINPPATVWQALKNQLDFLKERDGRIRTPEY